MVEELGAVPAVGGLQHHLGILTRPTDHLVQRVHVIENPHRLQDIARLGGPHQHRAAPMQINTDELSSCVL
jgi:hypothetical protein